MKTKHKKQQKNYQNMQRKSSILGPNIVDFGTHFDISSFPGPNMQHTHNTHLLFDRQTTDFLLKNGPQNGPQNHWIWVSIFTTFLTTHLDPYFNDFVSQTLPKWYPKSYLFWDLWPC